MKRISAVLLFALLPGAANNAAPPQHKTRMSDADVLTAATVYAKQACRKFEGLRKTPAIDFDFRTHRWVITFAPEHATEPDQECIVVVDDVTGKVTIF